MVGSIHEHKGKQELFLEANIGELKALLEVAIIQSTGASNRIEGIFTSDKRLNGNGRMSQLLTLLLFYKAGYIVGKYVSMKMLIEKTKETYYGALQSSSFGWHENKNNYEPFVKYYLGIM